MSQDHFRSSEGTWERLSQVAVQGAKYDSRERQPHPKCLEGTRVDLLDYIHTLLDDREKSQLIWLHGTAGVGKSAVAFTVAEKMKSLTVTKETTVEKRLAGTFFFSRKHTKRCTTGYFFATLVYQLASNFPSIRSDMNNAIRENPALLDPSNSLCDQMEVFFLRPLRKLKSRLNNCPPLTFVIDALDECTSEPELADLILLLARALRDTKIPVTHILLTSRTESHIRKAFEKDEVRPLVCEIPVKMSGDGVATIISLDGADVDNDTYIFLQHSFRELASRHPDFPQPSRDELERLASRAGRRFIVASTMMKFIDDGDTDPHGRLQLMLELTSKLLPGTEVYKLYDSILSTCADPKRAYLHLSIVVALADPLPVSQISKLLGSGLGRDVETTLVQLRSVMDIPSDSTLPVNIYHSSIRDYVSDAANCSLPQVHDMPSPQSLLAESSLRLMIQEIPESTALLDALLELQRHSQAIEPEDPQRLNHSLSFLVRPPEPLSILIGLLWLRGDSSSDLRFWVETLDGRAWLQTQGGGREWLRSRGGQEWLQSQGGLEWLRTEGGIEWLQTREGRHEWLQSLGGQEWLQTEGGLEWLRAKGARGWLRTEGAREWLRTEGGQEWLRTEGGREWLRTEGGRYWLQTEGGRYGLQDEGAEWPQDEGVEWPQDEGAEWSQDEGPEWPQDEGPDWLQNEGGQDWLQSEGEKNRLQTEGGQEWLRMEGGREWLQTLGGREWLQTEGGRKWLQTEGGLEWIKTREGRYWLQMEAGREWLQSQGGKDWLQTRGGREWLQNEGGQDWLRTKAGRYWLKMEGGQEWLQTEAGREWVETSGREWLQTEAGREWLQAEAGREWLQTEGGLEWIGTEEGLEWIETEGGRYWLQTQARPNWLQTQAGQYLLVTESGRHWLRTQRGQEWLQTEGGREWLQTWGGKNWLQNWSGICWLLTQAGHDWLRTQGGQDWLRTQGGQDWLRTQARQHEPQTQSGRSWLHTWSGGDWFQMMLPTVQLDRLWTQGGRDLLQTWREWREPLQLLQSIQPQGGLDSLQTTGGQYWLQTSNGVQWLQTWAVRDWLQTQGGKDWLQTTGGKDWLQTTGGRDWLQTWAVREWLQTQGGKDWLQTRRGQESQDWLQTRGGQEPQDWLQTRGGQDWLQTLGAHDWLQTQGAHDWLRTEASRHWLQTKGGRNWLQTLPGQHWLQTHHGQAWNSTCATSIWITLQEFYITLEAINGYIIVSEVPLLPAFLQQLKSLPDFLMFPIFLAFRHEDHSTSALPQARFPTEREIIHAMSTFVTFANEAHEHSRSASDALKYACQNWAVHLSRAPNTWDDKLDHIFQAFWNHHLLPWLEMQWCLKGLRSCLVILSDGQKFAKVR